MRATSKRILGLPKTFFLEFRVKQNFDFGVKFWKKHDFGMNHVFFFNLWLWYVKLCTTTSGRGWWGWRWALRRFCLIGLPGRLNLKRKFKILEFRKKLQDFGTYFVEKRSKHAVGSQIVRQPAEREVSVWCRASATWLIVEARDCFGNKITKWKILW